MLPLYIPKSCITQSANLTANVADVFLEQLLQADDDKNEECLPWETDDWLESAMKDEV